jgi:hypothetical protein
MSEKFNRELVYIAAPYSHRSAKVREMRFREANRISAGLIDAGILIFSPISHTHPIALAGKLPLGWNFWERYNRAYLVVCRAMVVLRMNGWQESKGVAAEMKIMDELARPVYHLDPYNADQFRTLVAKISQSPIAQNHSQGGR